MRIKDDAIFNIRKESSVSLPDRDNSRTVEFAV